MTEALEDALWKGDVDTLNELAPCGCCCREHSSLRCPARVWNGCRSGLAINETDHDESAWAAHYAKHHGMTEEEFYR